MYAVPLDFVANSAHDDAGGIFRGVRRDVVRAGRVLLDPGHTEPAAGIRLVGCHELELSPIRPQRQLPTVHVDREPKVHGLDPLVVGTPGVTVREGPEQAWGGDREL